MPIARNPRLKPLKEFAASLGARIKVEYDGSVNQAEYVLIDSKGEPVVREYDLYDMLDSIKAYYGGHPNYAEARAQFNYTTGEEE